MVSNHVACFSVMVSGPRSEEHTSELQSPCNIVCSLLLEKIRKIILEHYFLNTNTVYSLALKLKNKLDVKELKNMGSGSFFFFNYRGPGKLITFPKDVAVHN